MIELLNIDCMEYLKDCPDKAFDLAICDPPYGIGINGMNMGSRKTILRDKRTWDAEKPPQKYFDELRRVSLNQVIWGGNYFNLPQAIGLGHVVRNWVESPSKPEQKPEQRRGD